MGYTANKCNSINFLATTKCGTKTQLSFSGRHKTIKQQQKHRSEFEHKNYRKMFPFSIYDKRD